MFFTKVLATVLCVNYNLLFSIGACAGDQKDEVVRFCVTVASDCDLLETH